MRRRGVVIVIALFMLALVGAALTLLASATSNEAHRTLEVTRQAQIEQMLLAGAADAAIHLQTKTPAVGETWEIKLPENLASHGASLHTKVESIEDDGEIVLSIAANFQGVFVSQSARFKQGKLTSARYGEK